MDRKTFIKKCFLACLGTSTAFSLLNSCTVHNRILGEIEGEYLTLSLNNFEQKNAFKKHIIVEHPLLNYPIVVYRLSANDYKALLMKCTHQGAELQIFGDVLECPAHGSEFDRLGHVLNGPADQNLHSFPTQIFNNQLKIKLQHA